MKKASCESRFLSKNNFFQKILQLFSSFACIMSFLQVIL